MDVSEYLRPLLVARPYCDVYIILKFLLFFFFFFFAFRFLEFSLLPFTVTQKLLNLKKKQHSKVLKQQRPLKILFFMPIFSFLLPRKNKAL